MRDVLVDGVTFHDVLFTDESTWGGKHPDCLESYGFTANVTIRNSRFERCGNTFIGWYTDFGSNSGLVVENNLFHKTTLYHVLRHPDRHEAGIRRATLCFVTTRSIRTSPTPPTLMRRR